MWNEMSWDRMPGTGTEVPTIGEFLAGNPVPHLVPHDMSVRRLGFPVVVTRMAGNVFFLMRLKPGHSGHWEPHKTVTWVVGTPGFLQS